MFTKIFRIIVLAGIFLSLCEQSYAQESEINSGSVFYKGGQNYEPKVSSIIGTGNYASGQNSFAGGFNSYASGEQSFAFGELTEASQTNAFAIGKSTKAYGLRTFAMGLSSEASGENSFAAGNISKASGKQSFAIGHDCTASGENSFAGGVNSSASYIQSFAFGLSCNSNSPNSFALGHTAITRGPCSFALGQYVEAGNVSTSNSFVLGCGVNADNKLVNTLGGIMMGINSNVPTFFILKSDGIDHTGRVGIGNVTNPQAKLHIRSDEGEDAGIILEPKQPEANGTFIRLHDGNHGISVGTNGEMCISSGAENNKLPLTLNGHVGINTTNDLTNYQYALTVDGGILTDRVLIKSVDEWYDAVFTDNYRLMPLNELKDFVATHHHLPEVPAENEVMEEGYDMGEMQGLLLKKIEELTLYTIQLQEQIERQQKELELQQKEIEELKAK
ncbi:MAG: hypothetical protein MJZ97_02620 [Bacteroidales bacterium]|nr:hypothetical protein [Bacteroidales bacterium]